MKYLQITKWVNKTNDPNIWWRDIEDIFSIIPQADEDAAQDYINYIEKFLGFRNSLGQILSHHFRERDSNNNVFSCIVFNSVEQINEYAKLKETSLFLDYSVQRDKLLARWQIDMLITPVIQLDIDDEQLMQRNFLINTFNEHYSN